MNMLKNMKIGKRLLFSFGFLAIFIAASAGYALWGSISLNTAKENIILEVDKLQHTYQISANLDDIYMDMSNILLTPAEAQKISFQADIEKQRTAYKDNLAWLKNASSTQKGADLLTSLDQVLTDNRDLNNRVIAMSLAGNETEAAQVFNRDVMAGRANLDQAVTALLTYRKERMDGVNNSADDLNNQMIWIIGVGGVAAVLLAFALALLISRSVEAPVKKSAALLADMAKGDFNLVVDQDLLERKDEMGDIGRAVAHVLASLKSSLSQVRQGVDTLSSSSTELSAVSSQMSTTASETSSKAHVVAAAAEEMSANTISVAAGMEQASTSLRSVATATEEMTATIGEIAGNSEKARRITAQAVTQADRISTAVRDLGRSALEIGKVTETITSISNQTHLLALNATIEAARAGAAGKGFAVVATEIKELAQQTAGATEDIKNKVAGVQNSTASAVQDIEKIAGVIREVSEIVSTIATAIEEQSVVTRDIAGNISEAVSGVRDANERVSQTATVAQAVARDISGVSSAGQEMNNGSAQVESSAEELSRLAEQLRSMVAQFKLA